MANVHSTDSKCNIFVKVYRFYRDGFRSMTVGRTLWAIIAIKLVVFFLILRWIFFPDFLSSKADDDQGKAQYVREQLVSRSVGEKESKSLSVKESKSSLPNTATISKDNKQKTKK